MSYKYNFAMIISDSQQKYVVLKAMRRSNGITKNLLTKKLKAKVYVSFRISLYEVLFISETCMVCSDFMPTNMHTTVHSFKYN